MPWIGVYVAVASLICSLAMAADVFHGFHHKKLWFPCKFFVLNAASLTLLSVAMKLPVDLSTDMPGKMDQLAKLSSTTFLPTAIGNFMPSLGSIDDKDIFMNITALTIFVITILTNICIQLGTGLLSNFLRIEHTAVIFCMLVLFVISSFSALMVSTTKKHIQMKYIDVHKKASSEVTEETETFTVEKLKENVKKYWMTAETGNPQFVMAHSLTCSASGAICSLTTSILAEAEIRTFLMSKNYPYYFNSDYKWSIFFVLVIQSIGALIGTIGPTFRWFTAIRSKLSEERGKSSKSVLKAEKYWMERLVWWRESPLALRIRGQKCRKVVHITKNLILDFCINVQIVIVAASKSVLLVSVLLISPLWLCSHYYRVLKRKLVSKPSASNNHTGSESELEPNAKLDLSCYVSYLKGEEELALQIMKNNRNATDHFMLNGRKKHPKYLKQLIEKSSGFMGVAKFDSDHIPSLDSEELPNCWSLPVVTLTSIAIALPNVGNNEVDRLLRSISEGLLYVSHVEKFLDGKGEMVNIRNAANIVWLEVDLFCKWLNEDLQKMALEGKTSKETLERLGDIAKNKVMEFKTNRTGDLQENHLNWPIKAIAANSMYSVSQTVLLDHISNNDETDERLFEQLSVMIADILSACLTNLPRVITMKCFCSAIEKREKSIQHAAHLLGETEEILEVLQHYELPPLNPDEAAYR
ncbi:uncharacterized protein LOC132305404 [Cornus florida]|uniref:uncharacterized protein LOC132305404 n=1 Tax=Cornus florida TaxID=4283 RepID=UPI0028A27E2D|nr:uncharacterized protein LOC132305404 [Cornus florida]